MKNKRAMTIWAFLPTLFFLIAIFPTALFVANQKQVKFEKLIGETQIALLETYEKGEPISFYVDESAKSALRGVIYYYGVDGFSSGCEKYFDYNMIQGGCMLDLEDVGPAIKAGFSRELNRYFEAYFGPGELDSINYDIRFTQEMQTLDLVGTTEDRIPMEIRFPVHNEQAEETDDENAITGNVVNVGAEIETERFGYYYVNPSYHEKIRFDLNFFNESIMRSGQLIDALEREQGTGENITEDYVIRYLAQANDDEFKGFTIGYCDTFSDDDKACFSEGEIGYYGLGGGFDGCGRCPLLAFCGEYVSEDYCNLDPCGLGCIWEDKECRRKTSVQRYNESVVRFCIASDYKFPVFDERLNRVIEKPVVLKFAVNFTQEQA